jgi:hypothetical protein
MPFVTDVEVDWVPGCSKGQLATDAKIRCSFPNVRTIRNLPIIDYASVSWGISDRVTLRVNPSNPNTWIAMLSAARDFSQMRRRPEVLFPKQCEMSFSYNYMARPPKDEDEEKLLASFLATSPFIHAVETPRDPSELRFTDDNFKAHLRDRLVPLVNVDTKSLALTLTKDAPSITDYARSAAALGAILKFGSEGVRTLAYRCPKGGHRPTDQSIFTSSELAKALDGIQELEIDVTQGGKSQDAVILPKSLAKLTFQYPGRIASQRILADQLADSLSTADPEGEVTLLCIDEWACGDKYSQTNANLEEHRLWREREHNGTSQGGSLLPWSGEVACVYRPDTSSEVAEGSSTVSHHQRGEAGAGGPRSSKVKCSLWKTFIGRKHR